MKRSLILFMFFTFSVASAQTNATRESKVPYEIKFADVTFQLNDVTRYLMSQEVAAISRNTELKNEYLSKLSLVIPSIESLVENANVPADFKYLSIYNKFQKSLSASVVLEQGVFWCLDIEKAKDVDLIIDDKIDERKHLLMASKGAMVCLKRNQVLYENWGKTLFAHIASREVLKNLETNRKWSGNYIVLDSPSYSSLIQFLAFKWVMEAEFNSYKNPVQSIVYEYKNAAGKSLNLIAADLKIDPKELLKSNLWLKTNRVPEGDANILVYIPSNKYSEIRMLDEMSRNVGNQNMDLGFPVLKPTPELSKGLGGMFYTSNNLKGIQAEMCDDFVNLAYKADITNKQFLEYNEMTDKDFLQIGQVYYIEAKNDKAAIPHHIVKNDETLWDISQQYGVKLSKLLKYNRMETVGRLQRGRVVWMQTTRPKNKPIEYIEFPIENKDEKPERLKFDDELISQYVESKKEEELEEKPAIVEPKKAEALVENKPKEVFKSEVLTKNEVVPFEEITVVPKSKVQPFEPKLVVKEVPTSKVESAKPFSEELKETIDIPKNYEKGYLVHEVKKGETLYRISVNYKVSVNQLYKLNNLNNNIIEVGDKIIVRKY
ncbi:LysM peptidoglycan-binding domain-containing protein [Lacihabitans soyangensis]|nr:LysM peptidoglycan-binding domain-containing protein [Lacihabitans soyangensis]